MMALGEDRSARHRTCEEVHARYPAAICKVAGVLHTQNGRLEFQKYGGIGRVSVPCHRLLDDCCC